jgi:predicted metal-dependent phosphoesterase TrpH
LQKFKADLHIHSFFSDGKFSPITILEKAKKSGINIISITDHDSIKGVAAATENCKKYGVEVIPGIEFSCDFNDREVHLLGYFLDYENENLEEYLLNYRKTRVDRIRKMVESLNKLGCAIDADKFINSISSNISIGRPHLASAMVKDGFVKNYVEAFIYYIGDGKPAFVRKKNSDVQDVIKLISGLNGLSFIAHPGKNINVDSLNELVKLGINGIEVYHPSHSAQGTNAFLEFTKKNNLLVSGGTDFHGVIQSEYKNWGRFFIGKEEIENMKNSLPGSNNH